MSNLVCTMLLFLTSALTMRENGFVVVPWTGVSIQEQSFHDSGIIISKSLFSFIGASPFPQYRFARLQQPSQFGGEPCNSYGREEEACSVSPRYTCRSVPPCAGFLCASTGNSAVGRPVRTTDNTGTASH